MPKDTNLQRYVLQVFSSPNVVAFASERARSLLDSEFGVSVGSLLRPLGVESSSKFLWPSDDALKRSSEEPSDFTWQSRVSRESCPSFLVAKEVFQNKPKGSSKIWMPQNKIEEVKIRLQDKIFRNESFEVRFVSLCDLSPGRVVGKKNKEDHQFEQLIPGCQTLEAIRSYEEFMKQFPYNDFISSVISHNKGKQFEPVFKEILQNSFNLNVEDNFVELAGGLPLWFGRWFEAFHEELSFLNHESISQPIGGIVFVDISEDDPIESIIEITNSLRTGKNFEKLGGNPGYYLFGKRNMSGLIQNTNSYPDTGKAAIPHYLQESYLNDFPLIYIFINDERSGFDFTETDHNIISSFKLSFPESVCYIWNIRGQIVEDLERQETGKNQLVWPGTFSHPFKKGEKTFLANRLFTSDEMELLNSFVIDSVKNSFLPWLEGTINKLNNYVLQSRKGLKNHFRILWRRPRSDSNGSNSEGLLSTLGVGTTFSNMEERSQIFEHEISLFSAKPNSNGGKSTISNCVYYSSGSLEGQTRLAGDLCLISGMYSQSIQYYKHVLSEYKLDKSFSHIGSTFFSMAVAQILLDNDFEMVSDHCLNSSNSFLKSNDEVGSISSIKSLLLLSLVILSSPSLKKNRRCQGSSYDSPLPETLDDVCKSILNSLCRISSELQTSEPTLKPRSLFSMNKLDMANQSCVNYSNSNEVTDLETRKTPGNFKETNFLTIFGVINFLISKIISFTLKLSDSKVKIKSDPTKLSHSWAMFTAQSAQAFQDLGTFGICLKQYLSVLQHNKYSYTHTDRYIKLHSARLCQKLSLLPQSTLLYCNLILDIIDDQLSSGELTVIPPGNRALNDLQPMQSDEISLICYREFVRSFEEFRKVVGIENLGFGSGQLGTSWNSSLKIPLPILLPFGTALILETDSESLSKIFGQRKDDEYSNSNPNPCICKNNIPTLLEQKNFCSHFKSNNLLLSETSKLPNLRPKLVHEYGSTFNGNDTEFQTLLEKSNQLLSEGDFVFDGSEIAEFRSQYNLRRYKENTDESHSRPLISPAPSSSLTRSSFIKKTCSIEFYIYNPLSFPITCKSLQIWGYLRLSDGSTSSAKVVQEREASLPGLNLLNSTETCGIIFFEKSILLNPNETLLQRLSVLPLEAGELFIVGISFLLEGTIPIRLNFGTSSIAIANMNTKLSQSGRFQLNPPGKDNFGIQKINILGHSNSSSFHFGEIYQEPRPSPKLYEGQISDFSTPEHHDSANSESYQNHLFSGVPYTIPIKILIEKNSQISPKDSTLLVIPSFNGDFNIRIRHRNPSENFSNLNMDFNTTGYLYRLSSFDSSEANEFDLTLWVNSECSGKVYFVLLNSILPVNQSGSSSSKTKNSRQIVFASLVFFFKSSVSASCTVFPGQDGELNSLFLRIRNQLPTDISISNISAFPCNWLEVLQDHSQNSSIPESPPSLTILPKDSGEQSFNRGENVCNFQMKIPTNITFQAFMSLKSHNTETNLSLTRINLVLTWSSTSNFPDKAFETSPSLKVPLSGQVCIYNINLFDPYFHSCGIKGNEERIMPLSISITTRDITHEPHSNKSPKEDFHLVEAKIAISNVTINSEIACSVICNSRSLSSQDPQEDLLIPLENHQKSHGEFSTSNPPNFPRHISPVLESGELMWIGPTVTHLKLGPRDSKRVKLLAMIPFKGIFSTNSIQLFIWEKLPLFPRTKIKSRSKTNFFQNRNNLFYISETYWVPELFQNKSKITKFQIKSHQDSLSQSSSFNTCKIRSSSEKMGNLPAYVEKRDTSSKKPDKDSKSEGSQRTFTGEDSARQMSSIRVQGNEKESQESALLHMWLSKEESTHENAGDISMLSNTGRYLVQSLSQNTLKKKLIPQKPHQSHFLIRM
ncbi:TRAPP III complex Trs85 [Cryptosporidium felis]|nr:TRAPP III complex Trs85 [Cryptosporidium felis]